MSRTNRASMAIILGLAFGLVACGGGGGGGGSGDGGQGGSGGGALESRSVVADGWVGGGLEGWVTTGESPSGRSPTHLREPGDIFLARDGFLYVADTENDRIVKWSRDGTVVGWIGRGYEGWQTHTVKEAVDESHGATYRVTVDADGNVYSMHETGIAKWDAAGNPLGWIGGGKDGWHRGPQPTGGLDLRSFGRIVDLCVDAAGTIYVADLDNDRISRWSADGVAQGWIGHGSDGWKTEDTVPDLLPNGNPATSSDLRSFGDISGVAVDADGDIYASDTGNARVVKWSADGQFLGALGDRVDGWKTELTPHPWHGADLRSFFGPKGLFVDDRGDIYVADRGNHRVTRWSRDGVAQGWIGGGVEGWQTGDAPELSGSVDLAFAAPEAVSVDAAGHVYVTDVYRNRVSRWHRDGTGHGWIGGGEDGWRVGNYPPDGLDLRSFRYPIGLALGPAGDLHVADAGRIVKWTADGVAVGWIGHGAGGWQTGEYDDAASGSVNRFLGPTSVHVDATGTIFVADSGHHRIVKWSAAGVEIGWIGAGKDGWRTGELPSASAGTGRKWFRSPHGVSVAASGYLCVAEYGNHRVSRWSATGTSLGWIGHGASGWQLGAVPDDGGDGQAIDEFRRPERVRVASDGTIYVADTGNHRVCRWSVSGEPLGWIGGGTDGWKTYEARRILTGYDDDDDPLYQTEAGSTRRKFLNPTGLWIAPGGELWIADMDNARVSLWSRGEGASSPGWFGHGEDGLQTGSSSTRGGFGPRELSWPSGIAMSADGFLYVVNAGSHRISRWRLDE